ncbi:MAG: YkgJ family cysteine cluster protein [Proteobacteria bacterium]|nr:YkgJ family cysteine cluster protein [Pseudomonadota bacterium]
MPADRTALVQLHTDIDTRVATIRTDHPDWLCAKGCATCCRRLADVPQLTATEWTLLQEGLAALPAEHLQRIATAIAALGDHPPRPVTCPLLDPATDACLIYAHRPVACRTYGFYAQRDKGLYCKDIETRAADGALDDVVWGNHDAVDRQLTGLGDSRGLTEWFRDWKDGPGCKGPC